MVTLFFIIAILLIGMCHLQADAAEYIFDGYRIDAQLQSHRNYYVDQHGFLDLIQLNSSGELELVSGIQELSVTDRSGVKMPWEEAKSILSQALMRDLYNYDQPPWTLTGWALPVDEFITIITDRGHNFEIMATGGGSEVGHRAGVINQVKSHASRTELYKVAILKAVAMEQKHYFFKEVLKLDPDPFSTVVDVGLNTAHLALESADLIDEIATSFVQLRIQNGATQAIAHGQSEAVRTLIGNKVITRFGKTIVGKVAKGARAIRGAGKVLGPLALGLEVVLNVTDETERHRRLFQLRNDLVVLQGLNNLLLLMETLGDADPAMIDGIEAALHELADLSSFRWQSIGKGLQKTAPALLRSLGVLTLAKLGVAGPWGTVAGIAIYQVGEGFKAWNEWEESVLTISAFANLANYLHRNMDDTRIWDLVQGKYVSVVGAGLPIRELMSLRARLVAEGSAWLYNIIWAKRWSNWLSAGNIGDSLGKALPELIFKIFTGQDPQENWKVLVTARGTAFHHTQEVYYRLSTFIDQLKQVYVPRPDSEPISLADIVLIIDSSGSMTDEDPGNLRKSGAKLFIQSADPKVQIAIVDFDSSAQTFASLTFADAAGKQKLASAVERVDAGGSTNIDAGLQQGFQELNASISTAKKAAVLLTDGQDSVDQQVIQQFATKGWPVYTIGLGNGVERAELERIAHATGGEYFWASQASHIQTVYNKILAKTTNKSVLASLAGYINMGQQITKDVLIDENVNKVDVSCDWPGSTIELVLIDPEGTQITPQDAAANSRITYQSAPTYAIYTLENPNPGNWQMQATGTDIPAGGEPFNLSVNATSDFLTNFLSLDSSYAVGDTIRIGIEIDERTGDTFAPVLGATTSAKIVRPDGKIDTLTLHDDGSHNDVAANDGKYANNYRAVDKQGTYLIQVSVENGFSREIQEQVIVGSIDNVFIDGSTLIPAAGATLKQSPNVISAVISGPAGRINANSIVFKVDGKTVTHTYNQVNQLASYRPGGLSGGSHDVQLSVQDVSGSKIETIWSFSTEAIGAVTARTILTGHTGGVTSVAFSPDGQTIASGSDDNTVWLWDAATDTFNRKLTGHTGGVTSVAFSPNGQVLVSGSEDKTIRLWDVNTGTELKKITGHTGPVYSVAFSPDGQKLASTSANRTVQLWDINTGTQLQIFTGHTGAVFSVAFSPDGQRLASGGADNTVWLWDVNTGTQLGRLTGHTGAVFSVAFSPNETIASGGSDGTLHLWDVNTRTQLQIFTGHTGTVYSVVFSPDGQTIASGSSDKTTLLWDVNPGTQPQILNGHTDAVLSVVFSPDGQTIASGSRDNTVRLWGSAPDVQPPELTADVNGDGVVDFQDLTLVYANLGKYGQNDADVNGDGIVNAEDIILVTAAIEAAGGAPALHTQVLHLFTREEVQQWLTEARGLADKSPFHRKGIAVLEKLLVLLTPKETALLPNYPNPFNPETWIPYQLAKPADVMLTIYDINGRVVRALDLGHRHAGMYHSRSHAAYWDGKNKVGEPVASGVYFYTLKAGVFSATRKMLIRK